MVEILPPAADPVDVMVSLEPQPEDDQSQEFQRHSEDPPSFDSQAITEEALGADSGTASLGLAPPTATGFTESMTDSSSAPPVTGSDGISWESEDTRRKRQLGFIIALSTLSLFVCLAGFAWFVSKWKSDQTVSTGPNDPLVQSPVVTDSTDHNPATPQQDDSNDSTDIDAAPSNADPSEITGSTQDSAAVTKRPVEKPTNQPPETEEPIEGKIPSDLRPVSPIDEMVAPPTDPMVKPEGMQELPPGLAQYTQFLLEEGDIEKPTLEAPPSMDDLELNEATRELDNPIAPLRPKDLNIEAALAVKLAVNTDGYSLPKLALLISQITGVPIQIDWVSFDLGAKDLTTEQVLPEGWTSAQEILNTACQPFGAELRNEDSRVIITLNDATFSAARDEITALDDFENDKVSAVNLLSRFLELEINEQALVTASGNREDQQLTAITIEALRRARGIQPKVADKYLSRWIGTPQDPSSEWTSPTNGKSFLQSDVPITVAEFISRLSDENNVQALINWEDFTARRVEPEYVFMPFSGNGSAEMLDHAFSKFGIEARQVDSTHWWLGQRSTYDRLPVVTWTSPLLPDPQSARDELNSRLSQIVKGNYFRVEVDEVTHRGILVLPRYLAIQLPKITEGLAKSDR